jgi:uncharacterized protein with PQ loop repeat
MNLIWIALLFTLFSTVPQLIQLIQTKEARDFNTESQYLAIIANTLIAIESFRGGDLAALVLACWLITYRFIILCYKMYPPPGIVTEKETMGDFSCR